MPSLKRAVRQRRHTQSRPESLETRCLLATITVTSDADDMTVNGEVTLREAIEAANTNASVDGSTAGSDTDVDVIEFGAGVTAITLTEGQFDIEDAVIIRGPGGRVTIDADGGSRHFEITVTGAHLTLENLRVINGDSPGNESGGSILIGSTPATRGTNLTILNSQFEDNAGGHGGVVHADGEEPRNGVLVAAEYTIRDSTFTNNTSTGSGGVALLTGDQVTVIDNSTFTGNVADNNGGAVMVWDRDNSLNSQRGRAFLTVIDSTFTNNESKAMNGTNGSGGGLYYIGEGSSEVRGSMFTMNTAHRGGGVRLAGWDNATGTIRDSVISNNFAEDDGGGVSGGGLDIFDTTISDNISDGSGGGITASSVTLVRTTVANNTGQTNGGGVDINGNGGSTIRHSFIDGNTATSPGSRGGGVHSSHDSLTVIDTQISNNSLTGSQSSGGGLYARGELLVERSSLIDNDSGRSGGGAYIEPYFDGGEDALLLNTTIAGNTAAIWGGGIYANLGSGSSSGHRRRALIHNSTIVNNAVGIGGGGIYTAAGRGQGNELVIGSSIVAQNTDDGLPSDIQLDPDMSRFDVRNSVIGTNADTPLEESGGTADANGNFIGTSASPVDPGLTYMGTFDDSVPVLGLTPGSLAIDAGTNLFGTSHDNVGRPREAGAAPDIGAVEGGIPFLEFSDVTLAEGDAGTTSADMTVTLMGDAGGAISVGFATSDDTATAGDDYQAATGTVGLAGNDGDSDTISVLINGDETIELDETLMVDLTTITGAGTVLTPVGPAGAPITITNDDVTGVGLSGRTLVIGGTAGDDVLAVAIDGLNYDVTLNGDTTAVPIADIDQAIIRLFEGNDDADLSVLHAAVDLMAGDGNDTVLGSEGDDLIEGGEGNDEIDGGLGNDEILGNAGEDRILGGPGDDRIVGGPDADDLEGGFGRDDIAGGKGDDTMRGQGGRDTIRGNDGNDELFGGSDNDSLEGGTGNDTLLGATGFDRLFGEEGMDLLRGGRKADVLEGGDDDDLLIGDADNDTLDGGGGNDSLHGNTGDDLLRGRDGDDLLRGAEGQDALYGHEGADILIGDAGNDFLSGEEGADDIRGNEGDDFIRAGEGDDVVQGGPGADFIEGDEGNDHIRGGDGNDELHGDDGDDILLGQGGRDYIVGGNGADRVVGGDDEDLLVAGRVDLTTQRGLAREWFTTDRDHAQRRINVRGGVGRSSDRLNGTVYLRSLNQNRQTVFDDAAVDVLRGEGGMDFFYAHKDGGAVDRVFREVGEFVDEI